MRYQKQPMPPFNLMAYHQNQFKAVKDSDLLNHWSVLFFYPADFTFVCPTELADLGQSYEALQGMGVKVYSVSTDTHFTHKAWHDASETIKALNFPMLADPAGHLSKALGVYDEQAGLADRATFVFNPDGIIELVEITPDGVGRNAEELIRKIKAAQYVAAHPGQACPAKWSEGEKTLTPSLDLVGKI
jgi:peroxiredoxin (alkyl hydroperoxide reductase subunit C)